MFRKCVLGRWAVCMGVMIALALESDCIYAQSVVRYADDPSVISVGDKLSYRSDIVPYPSPEEAMVRAGSSSYVVPLGNWERQTANNATRFSSRFKYRYAWDNRAVIFRIENVSSSFSVYVNGAEAGYSQNGAGRSEFDITRFIQDDYNSVEVVVYDNAVARRLESGRHNNDDVQGFEAASVITQPAVRIDDVFTEVAFDGKAAYLSIDVVTQSILLNPKEYVIMYELFDPSGRSIARAQKTLNSGTKSRDMTHFVAEVPDPKRWTHESPDLYTLVVGSRYEGRNMEFMSFKTGLCDANFNDGQLYIGGFPVILRSVRYASGENRAMTLEKLERFKKSGYNCIVVDGTPQPDYFYGLCDSIGMYVCDAANINAGITDAISMKAAENPSNNPEWHDAYLDRAKSMYYSSHIHPSVVMYSPARNSGNGYCLYESYMLLRGLSGKPVYYGEADGFWNNDIETDELFNKPSAGYAEGGIEVDMTHDGSVIVITIRNAGDLKPVDGTYKLTLKSGRKEIGKTMGELNLSAGENKEIVYELPAEGIAKGVLTVEISSRKSVTPVSGGKLSDLYDMTSYSFKL